MDWSAEEKAWKDGIQGFLLQIEQANPDLRAHQKSEEKKEEDVKIGVIIKEDKAGEPVVGPLANTQPQPPRPKDQKMANDYEDLFGPPTSSSKQEEPKKKEEPKKEEVFASSGKDSKFENFPPVAPAAPVIVEEKQAPKAEKTKINESISLCDGFDETTFKTKVMSVVEAVMAQTPELDLDQMQDSVGDYIVSISVDAYRSDLDSISNHIAEIQAKRDSIISPLIKLSSTLLAMDEVLDFAINIGVSCSSASNRERRVSEVHYMTGDLFKKYTRVKHINEQYDKIYRHLGSQMEALSRLLTAQIERAKQVYLGSQRHEDLKAASQLHEKGMVSSQGGQMTSLNLDDEIKRMASEAKEDPPAAPQMPFDIDAKTPSKPTQAVDEMGGLETFSAAPVKKFEKFKKGVVEF